MRTNLDIFRNNTFPSLMDQFLSQFETPRYSPALDVEETKDQYIVNADMPGFRKEDIKIEAHDGMLNVSGERKFEKKEESQTRFFQERSFGKFHRTLRLPLDADLSRIGALYKDGVLTIEVPKSAEKAPQEIPIKTA